METSSQDSGAERPKPDMAFVKELMLMVIRLSGKPVDYKQIADALPEACVGVMHRNVYANPWYEARGWEMVGLYFKQHFEVLGLVEYVRGEYSRGYVLTELGQKWTDHLLEQHTRESVRSEHTAHVLNYFQSPPA